ncbi:hypothetical protein GCM10011367_05120 [Marinicauda pacifica]|uniref:Mechanosensitive ion channel family protein n=1 Tax=Marinicauda pacifica TaxID=1133559 RepID=A0A4S2HDW7_9PROT|nr:mechanosensitive ion channel family protein [Marinicauda pacifica]TGY94186.1 mechanosensitive ion channel family protein [Marinicauda pacifica]GGE33655.1 hypothetical protein GCM10011367_05120 [Marinicauda pacifica]
MQQTPPDTEQTSNSTGDSPDPNVGSTVDNLFDRLNASVRELYEWSHANQSTALTALAIAAGIYLTLLVLRMIIAAVIKRFADSDPTSVPAILSRAISKIGSLFLLVIAIASTAALFPVPEPAQGLIRGVLTLAIILQTAALVQEVAVSLLVRRAQRGGEGGSGLANAVGVLRWLLVGVIWIITFIILLDTAGVQVTALIAGLGVGGIAIGLAAQGIFSDLFASISILSDKPFKKGDFIMFGTIWGTVEEIGLRTTRIRSLSGEQITVSNTDLIGERVHNYQRLQRRRHVMNVGVLYQTPAETIEAIPKWVREDWEKIELLTIDRLHFIGFGDSSLNFEFVCWVEAPDFVTYRDTIQAAALAVMRRFADEGVDFAYPTRTLFMAEPSGNPIDPRGLVKFETGTDSDVNES